MARDSRLAEASRTRSLLGADDRQRIQTRGSAGQHKPGLPRVPVVAGEELLQLGDVFPGKCEPQARAVERHAESGRTELVGSRLQRATARVDLRGSRPRLRRRAAAPVPDARSVSVLGHRATRCALRARECPPSCRRALPPPSRRRSRAAGDACQRATSSLFSAASRRASSSCPTATVGAMAEMCMSWM